MIVGPDWFVSGGSLARIGDAAPVVRLSRCKRAIVYLLCARNQARRRIGSIACICSAVVTCHLYVGSFALARAPRQPGSMEMTIFVSRELG